MLDCLVSVLLGSENGGERPVEVLDDHAVVGACFISIAVPSIAGVLIGNRLEVAASGFVHSIS